MCTVSFIPLNEKIFLTSNRDEKISRKKAIPPALNEYKKQSFLFPKDADAGGTWIVAKENGDAAVLLNGAFTDHVHQPPYRKSRGLILLDIMSDDSPSSQFNKIDLENIEPFTIVLMENGSLFECRWDGNKTFLKQLSIFQPKIWSSATLYNSEVVKKREQWFADFIYNNPEPSKEDIFNFHQFTGGGDLRNDILMYRDGAHSTVSITCIEIGKEQTDMIYLDLSDNKEYKSGFIRKALSIK